MTSHSLTTKNWCPMLGCPSSRSRKRTRFGTSFAIGLLFQHPVPLLPLLAVVNNLQYKPAMARVSLSSVSAFIEGEAKWIKRHDNAYDSQCATNFLFDKDPNRVSAMVHASMIDKTYQVQVSSSDSLRAWTRRSHTKRSKNLRLRRKWKYGLENKNFDLILI